MYTCIWRAAIITFTRADRPPRLEDHERIAGTDRPENRKFLPAAALSHSLYFSVKRTRSVYSRRNKAWAVAANVYLISTTNGQGDEANYQAATCFPAPSRPSHHCRNLIYTTGPATSEAGHTNLTFTCPANRARLDPSILPFPQHCTNEWGSQSRRHERHPVRCKTAAALCHEAEAGCPPAGRRQGAEYVQF